MHASNRAFWKYCSQKYKRFFHSDPEGYPLYVLEVGSMDVNGSVRDYFSIQNDYDKYIGVDWRAGKAVDVVCLAHEMNFDYKFDTVVSASMLEHDPYWDQSIPKMVEHMDHNGILLLSWGAALNPPHEHDTACDGVFHSLPAYKVFDLLKSLGVYIHEFRYEGLQFPELCTKIKKGQTIHSGMGEVCLVAFTDKQFAIGESHIDKFVREDRRPK